MKPVFDITGERFGKLVVRDEGTAKNKSGQKRRMCLCQCDCGEKVVVEKANLVKGIVQSCGCGRKDSSYCNEDNKDDIKRREHSRTRSVIELADNEAFRAKYNTYKYQAKKRGYSFELTKEEFRNIITQPCIYCGSDKPSTHKSVQYEGGNFRYTGIDRHDNAKGYTVDNCVPCCGRCNAMKNNMSISEFKDRISAIASRLSVWEKGAC